MSADIFGTVTEALSPDVLHKISGYVGELQHDTKTAMEGAVSAVLAGMLGHASSGGDGLSSLVGMLTSGKIDSFLLGNIGSMMHGSAAAGLIDTGRSVVTSALGSNASHVERAIAADAGVQPASAVSILNLAGPLVLAAIGKVMDGIPSVSGLTSLLTAQKASIMRALPPDLEGVLGGVMLSAVKAAPAHAVHAHGAAEDTDSGGAMGRIIGFILVAAAVIGGLFAYLNSGAKPADAVGSPVSTTMVNTAVMNTATDTAAPVMNGSKPVMSGLGEFSRRKLPNGMELNIPKLGVENKLLDYIEDASKKPDDATWFDFDRLLFDTASTLQPSSQEQLQNIANILKAYPKVKVRIGGYTDNTGDKDANVRLSANRANTVMAALVKLGVDPSRMDAKGYGDDHPVADNATEEGRAKNRRISMRVIEK